MAKRQPARKASARSKDNRDVPNKVMSTAAERDKWHAVAEAAGLTFSTWARIVLQAAVDKK